MSGSISKWLWMPVILLLGMAGIPAIAQESTSRTAASMNILQAVEAEISTLFETNRACVVRIHSTYGKTTPDLSLGLGNGYTHGTGFLIDGGGHILTVDKAVDGAAEIRVTMVDGSVTRAVLVASDPKSDVAVIRVEDPPVRHVSYGNSDNTRIGHYTFILGNAFGELLPSIGSVYEITEGQDLIQITSSVYPSYGGAPVFDSSGSVMGMGWAAPLHQQDPGRFRGTAELPTSVFIIPINRARRIASTLIEKGQIAYGWLGVEVDRETHPVVVTNVAEGGPAWRSGIRPGDEIMAYNGRPVDGPFHLERLVMETAPGDSVPIRVKCEKITLSTEAEVTGRTPRGYADNPYLQLVGIQGRNATSRAPQFPDQALVDQIQTLQQEIVRLRVLMQSK